MEELLMLIPSILGAVSSVENAVNTGLSFSSVLTAIDNPDVLNIFTTLGAKLFPKAAPELQAVAAIVSSYSPSYTAWVQGALNKIVTPSPNLDVDSAYGPKTQAAVEALQSQLGLTVDGWAGDITSAAIQLALSKLG